MTSKNRLRRAVEELTEAEAADVLDYLARRRSAAHDRLGELLEQAPIDDEPSSRDEHAGMREAREQIMRGEVFPAEQIKREIA